MLFIYYFLKNLTQIRGGFKCNLLCCRDAFSGFDAEVVAKYNEKKIYSTSIEYGIELSQVRGVVDNSKRILEVINTN